MASDKRDKALYDAKNEGRSRLVARTFDMTDEGAG